jgi:hypothetical protein
MKPQITLTVFLAFLVSERVFASDLELAIRPHAGQVVFGDPIYIEVLITNRGNDAVVAPAPHPEMNTIGFKVYDPDTDLEISSGALGGGFVGAASPVRYEPGKSISHYWAVFLPALTRINNPFWSPVQLGKSLQISAVYGLRPGLAITSNREEVYVEARDATEMRSLERWANLPIEDCDKGPHVSGFGLKVHAVNRQQTAELASQIKPGEIADLLHLTIQMQELYKLPAEERDPYNRSLIAWLQKQPNIKRQALASEAQRCASNYNLSSTIHALQSFANERQ